MTLLTAGCSFTSGWGFQDPAQTWAYQTAQRLGAKLENTAQTAASNQDIFLSTLKARSHKHDIILVQWTALNRITVSPSPVNPRIILSYHNQYLEQSLPKVGSREIGTFVEILSMLNQDWKHFFDLVDMIELLQQDPRIYFINGLLPWDLEFFKSDWTVPLTVRNRFLEFLLQSDQFDDQQLGEFLHMVMQARNRIDQSRWVNLTNSWDSSKLDTVSASDPHPGPMSQAHYADQIYDFIKEKNA